MKHPRLIPWILLGVVLITFGRTLLNDFVNWDDGMIFQDFQVPTPEVLVQHWSFDPIPNHAMYNPLVFTLWWYLAHVAIQIVPASTVMSPVPFHAANLIVHWLTTWIVLGILRRLKFSDSAALLGAILFAVHPMQTEPVAWATGMKDLLCGLFAMLCIWCYLRDWYSAATGLCALALLSKPSAVVLVPIAVTLDLLITHRRFSTTALRMLPWLILSAAATVIAMRIQSTQDLPHTPLWTRPLVAGDALAFYLGKLLIPWPLSFDYGRSPTSLLANRFHPLYWTWIFPAALVGILIWSRKPILQTAGLIFLAGFLPVLGLTVFVFQIYSTVADRYAYIPMFGVAISAAWVLDRFPKRPVRIAAMAVALGWAGISFAQVGVWHDSRTLLSHGIPFNPSSKYHHEALAVYDESEADRALHADDINRWRALTDEAIDQYRIELSIDPTRDYAYARLSDDLDHEGRKPEAIEVTRQWLAALPAIPQAQRTSVKTVQAQLDRLTGR